MGSRAALKLIESPFVRQEVSLWEGDDSASAHSLHGLLSWPDAFPAALPSYFIRKYTMKGDTVLDPFCGGGTTPLEAKLNGRVPIACDAHPLAVRATRAKLNPADLTEVTLRLQLANLKRPVDTASFNRMFSEFYDIATYRELVNLREMLAANFDRVAGFIESIALGLLHGHSAGYFSVYTNPHAALSPEAQLELNLKRGQAPDYRAVVPRLLRKTAVVLRDGIHSSHRSSGLEGKCALSDARNMTFLPDGSVNLVVTAPPLPGAALFSREHWLRLWFARVQSSNRDQSEAFSGMEGWLDFMNEVLFEMARVVIPGGRAVLDLCEMKVERTKARLDEEVQRLVEESLPGFWSCESVLVHREKSPRLEGTRLRRETDEGHRILVLRRR